MTLAACGRSGFSPETSDPGPGGNGTATPTPIGTGTPSQTSGLDPNFGTMGRAQATSGKAHHAAVDPNGRLLIAGEQPNGDKTDATVVAFLSSGAVDSSFGSNGLATLSLGANSWANDVLSIGGRIWVGGGNNHAVLASIAADGSNLVTNDLNGSDSKSEVMALSASGAFFYVGILEKVADKNYAVSVERRDSTGALDPTFGTAGRATLALGDVSLDLTDIATTMDGGVVLAATVKDVANVIRFDSSGALVSGNFPYKWTPGGGVKVLADSITVPADGSILLTGELDNGQAFVLKLGNDGTLDPYFGAAMIDLGTGSDYASRACALADGTILVGATGSGPGVLRLDAYGQRISTYGTNGWVALPLDSMMDPQVGSDMVPDGAGGYLVVGTNKTSPDAFIAGRFLP